MNIFCNNFIACFFVNPQGFYIHIYIYCKNEEKKIWRDGVKKSLMLNSCPFKRTLF